MSKLNWKFFIFSIISFIVFFEYFFSWILEKEFKLLLFVIIGWIKSVKEEGFFEFKCIEVKEFSSSSLSFFKETL